MLSGSEPYSHEVTGTTRHTINPHKAAAREVAETLRTAPVPDALCA